MSNIASKTTAAAKKAGRVAGVRPDANGAAGAGAPGAAGMGDGATAVGLDAAGAPRPADASRKVRLTVSRVNPWSVAKMGFLLSFAVAIVGVVAAIMFWLVVDDLGVFATAQSFINDVLGPAVNFDIVQYFEFGRVVALASLLGVINIIILTAMAAVMAILYNITAALVGGLHVTLTDD
jgi:hypothetical protein